MKDYGKIHNQNLINKLFEIQISHPRMVVFFSLSAHISFLNGHEAVGGSIAQNTKIFIFSF